jgi:hypothetical protein
VSPSSLAEIVASRETWVAQSLWPGATFVVIGSGPSLTKEDCWAVYDARNSGEHREIRIIAINDAYQLAWFADVLYAPDLQWWQWKKLAGVTREQLPPRCFTWDPQVLAYYDTVTPLGRANDLGLSPDRSKLASGGFSGYAALNLSVHLGPPSRILTLGFDMQAGPKGQHHFNGEHPNGNHINYPLKVGNFKSIATELKALKIPVINCSKWTSVTAFPRMGLADALRECR